MGTVVGDLQGNDPILRRIERKTNSKFDHGRPADVLIRKKDVFLGNLSEGTLDRFEKLLS